jgi:hypothetical protein
MDSDLKHSLDSEITKNYICNKSQYEIWYRNVAQLGHTPQDNALINLAYSVNIFKKELLKLINNSLKKEEKNKQEEKWEINPKFNSLLGMKFSKDEILDLINFLMCRQKFED